ncbi:MAG: LPS assembly protein LptD [Planctomycetes bacterium]|nr:LPS assembly protein LptD [Planctomycetota bacterium]
MLNPPRLGVGVALAILAAGAVGQGPAPIADRVERALLPSGISELGVALDGELVYLFQDEDGTDAAHYLGGFELRQGDRRWETLKSREAVVWITHREYRGRPYRHLEILLWRDAEIRELGGTTTAGPALFVTLNTFGEITTSVDDLAFQSSADRNVYREGNAIRKAVGGAKLYPSDEDISLRVLDTSGLASEERPPKVRLPVLFQSSGEFSMRQVGDRQLITVVGGAYLSRGDPASSEFLEIRADSVVVFLPVSEDAPNGETSGDAGLGGRTGRERNGEGVRAAGRRGSRDRGDRQVMAGALGDTEIEAVYLEGDVQMSQGAISIRASRLYYDFVHEKAIILDAVVHAMLEQRNLPIYLRAAEVRQLSASHFVATDAVLTTSEFYTPHYHIGARRVELIDRTPMEPTGRAAGVRAGSFRIRDATLNLRGHPVAWWPYLRGSVDTSETAIKSLRLGFSNDFGMELETKWHLFNVLGLQKPDGVRATFSLDYFSERGPGAGIDVKYERDTYFGVHRNYALFDDGEDNLGRKREDPPDHDTRGRILLRHRHYLDDDWELSLELSYISDESFLEEFFESEFDNDKEQETLLYLKKQRDHWAFTATVQTRILDFTTQTERFPDLAFHLAGESLGTWGSWFSENRVGIVRRRAAVQTFRELLRDGRAVSSGAVMRVDSRQEVDVPLDLGPIRIVPFASVRGTAWDDSPHDGGLSRGFATVGIRGSMYLWRVYPEFRSTLFDIDGVRHIIKPDITAWIAQANRDSEDLFEFDETVETIDEVDGFALGIRQRWQTKRGEGDNRRNVDFLTLDVELGFFNDATGRARTRGYTSFSRPENSIAANYVNSSLIWRINDRTALLSELNYDVNDGELDIFNFSLVVERPPRFSYLVGYRFIGETNSNLLGFDLNYRLTAKHTLAIRELFDLQRGRTLDFTIAFIRKFPRWFGALSFELDDAEDDFGVSVSIWPEGLPQAALGSRRFTGLAGTTRIQND